MSDARAKYLLDQLYAELPTIECRRRCHSACGPITMSRIEWARIIKKLGYEPHKQFPDPTDRVAISKPGALDCPMLTGGLCTVYAIRPMICRLWGICEGMPCPWGCKPEPRYLTTLESYDLLLRAELISQPEHADEINAERERYRANPDLIALAEMFHVKPRIEG